MPKEFINPNLHVILIHYPLGLLTIGTLIELIAMVCCRRSAFRAAGRWMILIGALALVPASTVGLYAMADVNRTAENIQEPGITWAEVRAQSPIQGHAWEMMTRHTWLNAFGSAVLLLLVVLWLASSDAWRSRLHLLYLLILLGGLSIIIIGAWYGGEMVYRHGIGIETPSPNATESSDAPPAMKSHSDWKSRVAYYADPLQVHVILAGSAIALALAALGVSLRRSAVESNQSTRYDNDIASAFSPQPTPQPYAQSQQQYGQARPTMPGTLPPHYQTQDPAAAAALRPHSTPRSRFWLLAALLGVAAALSGWWTLAYFSDTWRINDLWPMVMNEADAGGYRRMAHFITGAGIIVLLLVLAVVARIPIARRIIVLLFGLALLAAVVAQIWFGSLLMFDSNMGDLKRFNGAERGSLLPPLTPGEVTPATLPATTAPVVTAPDAVEPAGNESEAESK